ncbi:hypothetical protein GGU11DRAFT_779935 [Lentinula aff. detonsa]|nr:hypothetical protein GGU11DRAFT_779935 [Lentinula aff. detonsa]
MYRAVDTDVFDVFVLLLGAIDCVALVCSRCFPFDLVDCLKELVFVLLSSVCGIVRLLDEAVWPWKGRNLGATSLTTDCRRHAWYCAISRIASAADTFAGCMFAGRRVLVDSCDPVSEPTFNWCGSGLMVRYGGKFMDIFADALRELTGSPVFLGDFS